MLVRCLHRVICFSVIVVPLLLQCMQYNTSHIHFILSCIQPNRFAGTDHAGIANQSGANKLVIKQFNQTRQDLDNEKCVTKDWEQESLGVEG